MQSWKSIKDNLLKDKSINAEYQALKTEYSIISKLIDARIKRGLTQSKLAEIVGTKQSAIARLESGNNNVTLKFLQKLAHALNTELVIDIKPLAK